MSDTLASQFIIALDPVRDRLYGVALSREATPAKAESLLQRAVRTLFPEFAKDPYMDVPEAVEKALAPPTAPPIDSALLPLPSPNLASQSPGTAGVAMPADVWARLAAAVQLAAAKAASTPGATALNPESVLLSPDPLLAPKKQTPAEYDDLSSPSRFLFTSMIAILIGVVLTIYILTRPATPSATRSAGTQAASHE